MGELNKGYIEKYSSIPIREGLKKIEKIMENSIMGPDPPPLNMEKNKVIFF